jgi:acetolactate synthase-1/2/3 large subunit
MAEGYAKATGTPGVIMVTSGPGALNITTSLQNALSDGTPLLALTGQVATTVIGTDAFQEADVVGITKPCTKWNTMITNSATIESTVDRAFTHILDKRHGPVLLDLPKNIMGSTALTQVHAEHPMHSMPSSSNVSTISHEEIRQALITARRPIVLVGQGVFQADAVDLLRQFIDLYKLPVTTTLLALGSVNEHSPRSLKMLGMHGSYAANMAIQQSDLILNLGSRFDDRIIGNPALFAPHATILHIDIQPKNINKTIPTKFYRTESCRTTLEYLVDNPVQLDPYHIYSWWKRIQAWKTIRFSYPRNTPILQGRHILAALGAFMNSDRMHTYTIVSDVGAHQMWAAQFIDYDSQHIKFLTSGGLGTMGFALPASIGVKLGKPAERVICVCGDGGFMMTFQELVTAVENNIGIKVLILNNSYQLMVKIWQEKFYNGQIMGTKMNNPPFEEVCRALGCEALRVEAREGLDLFHVIAHFVHHEGPIVLNVITDPNESVLPMVSPGKALDDMILEETPMSGDPPC